MYALTLTTGERAAFDWVGDRYASGQVSDILRDCLGPDDEWDQRDDVTFVIPENKAWKIQALSEEDDGLWPCFSSELVSKLYAFLDKIV